MPTKLIAIESINADASAQPREHISTDLVASYSDDMTMGAKFPPLIVFQESDTYWLADGFHRFFAARGVAKKIECDVRQGGLRDAVLYSCSANAAHGLRRTNEDKRRAVMKLLADDQWSRWSDREIAERCAVSHVMVGDCRKSLEGSSSEARTYVNRHGSISRMPVRDRSKAPVDAEQSAATLDDAYPAKHDYAKNARGQYGWMARAFWDIEKLIDAMPTAQMAVDLFPDAYRVGVSADKIAAQAQWLQEFAELWRSKREAT